MGGGGVKMDVTINVSKPFEALTAIEQFLYISETSASVKKHFEPLFMSKLLQLSGFKVHFSRLHVSPPSTDAHMDSGLKIPLQNSPMICFSFVFWVIILVKHELQLTLGRTFSLPWGK